MYHCCIFHLDHLFSYLDARNFFPEQYEWNENNLLVFVMYRMSDETIEILFNLDTTYDCFNIVGDISVCLWEQINLNLNFNYPQKVNILDHTKYACYSKKLCNDCKNRISVMDENEILKLFYKNMYIFMRRNMILEILEGRYYQIDKLFEIVKRFD